MILWLLLRREAMTQREDPTLLPDPDVRHAYASVCCMPCVVQSPQYAVQTDRSIPVLFVSQQVILDTESVS